jgi:hypothetical protein
LEPESDGSLSEGDLSIVLSALWVWRAQLNGVGSGSTIPGLVNADVRKDVDRIAQKLGGDPEAYFFGLSPSAQRC